MAENLTRKIIADHLVGGQMVPGEEIALHIDQTLLQDATGTLAWLQFDKLGVAQVRNRVSVTYVDHNMIQADYLNADDHLFLQSMAAKYGAIFSRPGNGISHFAHLERFDRPGEILLGSDSHTCTAGAMGMLAIGMGGMEVGAVMAGHPLYIKMPKVVNVWLKGHLPPWVSAKDVILELLRRLTVSGGLNRVMEYTGPGAQTLSVYERATICNMTQELGATSGLFASDEMARRFLKAQDRQSEWRALEPDVDAPYDEVVEVDLSTLEPLIAKPHSPDNVVPVREVAGTPVRQVAFGSSVNSGYLDLIRVAHILRGQHVAKNLSATLSPGSRQILINLEKTGATLDMAMAGVRGLEVACGPCIGMGFAPPFNGISLRTFNRNFPGRSGTANDQVYLCSPEVAAATALKGTITDPRDLGMDPPQVQEPDQYIIYTEGFLFPPEDKTQVEVYMGPNIKPVPLPVPLTETIQGEVLLYLGDNISTDDILPAGAKILPLRSNIPAISEFAFAYRDPTFHARAVEKGGGLIIGGENYGQGSSREHAAIAVMFLGGRAVVARSFARIHQSNLVNWGVLPVTFENPEDYFKIALGDHLSMSGVREAIRQGHPIILQNQTQDVEIPVRYDLTPRQGEILLAGGLLQYLRAKTV